MKKILITLILITTSWSLTNAQQSVYMPYMEIIGMHPDYQYSLTRLFRTYVHKNGVYNLILPVNNGEYYMPESYEQARKHAADTGAAYFMLIELNRLGDVVIGDFSMYNVADGSKVWGDMLKANNPDDFDPILQRVAATMGTDKKASEEMDIYSVTDYDSEELKKVKAHYLFGFTVGGAQSFVADVDHTFGGGLGLMFSYDIRDMILNINGEMYFKDVNIYYLSVDALYPFSQKRSTPYVMGSLGYGGMTVNFIDDDTDPFADYYGDPSNGGLMLLAGGGYIFNRTSDVNLRLGLKGFLPFYQIDGRTIPGMMFTVSVLMGRR